MENKKYISDGVFGVSMVLWFIGAVCFISGLGTAIEKEIWSLLMIIFITAGAILFIVGAMGLYLSIIFTEYEKKHKRTKNAHDELLERIEVLKNYQKLEDFELMALIQTQMKWEGIAISLENLDIGKIKNALKEEQKEKEEERQHYGARLMNLRQPKFYQSFEKILG